MVGLAPLSLVGKLLHGLLVCAGDTTLLGGQSEVDYGELYGKNSFSNGLSTLYTGTGFNCLKNPFRVCTLKLVSLELVASEATCTVGFRRLRIIMQTCEGIFDIPVVLIRSVCL